MAVRSQSMARRSADEAAAPAAAPRIVWIGVAGLDGACFCHLMRTGGADVDFIDIREPPSLKGAHGPMALVQVDADTPWRDWLGFLRSNAPDLRLGVLMMAGDSELEAELFDLGVTCFLQGGLSADVAVAALELARVGGVFVPPEIAGAAYRRCADLSLAAPLAAPSAIGRAALTGRERQIIDLLRRGLQNKNIAHHLSISESTVKVHLRNVMKKLHASNRTQVAFILDNDREL